MNIPWDSIIKLITTLLPIVGTALYKIYKYLRKERKKYEVQLSLVELHPPPENVRKTALTEQIKKQKGVIIWYKTLAWFYLVFLCLQLFIVYFDFNLQEVGFAFGIFLPAFFFAYMTSYEWRRLNYLSNFPTSPVGLMENHLVREMIFLENKDFLVNRALGIQLTMGELTHQITRENSDTSITFFKLEKPAWYDFQPDFNPFNEMEVRITQKTQDECILKVKVPLDQRFEKNLERANKFIKSFLTQDRAQEAIEEIPRKLISN